MTVSRNTYIAEMLEMIGWRQWRFDAKPVSAVRYPRFDWSEELVGKLDAVLLSSEPFRFTDSHVQALQNRLGKRVVLVDGEMLSWYGSRAIQGMRYLQELAIATEF